LAALLNGVHTTFFTAPKNVYGVTKIWFKSSQFYTIRTVHIAARVIKNVTVFMQI
jgi:hypothetical protein